MLGLPGNPGLRLSLRGVVPQAHSCARCWAPIRRWRLSAARLDRISGGQRSSGTLDARAVGDGTPTGSIIGNAPLTDQDSSLVTVFAEPRTRCYADWADASRGSPHRRDRDRRSAAGARHRERGPSPAPGPSDAFEPAPSRSAMISASTEMATSQGAFPPMSSPIGAWSLALGQSSATPARRNASRRSPNRRRAPNAPM